MGKNREQFGPERQRSLGNTYEDKEYYRQDKECISCNKRFTVSASKNMFSRNEASQFFEKMTECGACKYKDKIDRGAKQMREERERIENDNKQE